MHVKFYFAIFSVFGFFGGSLGGCLWVFGSLGVRFCVFCFLCRGPGVFGSRCGRLGVCGSLGWRFWVLWLPWWVASGLCPWWVPPGFLAFPWGVFLLLGSLCCCLLALLVSLWFLRFVVFQGSQPAPPQGASPSVAPPGVSLLVFIQTLGLVRAGYRRRRGRGSLRCSSEAGVCWVPLIDPP